MLKSINKNINILEENIGEYSCCGCGERLPKQDVKP